MDDMTKESPGLAKNMKRCNKQLMEKRRRERINVSLDQLKGLVLHATRKDSAQYSKLEKADILEMTVKHLRGLQQQQLAMAAATDSSVLLKFRAGFHECAGEVSRYLGTIDSLNPEVRNRLMHHLAGCASRASPIPETPTLIQAQPPTHIQMPSATQLTNLPGSNPQALMANSLSIQVPTLSPQQIQLTGAFQVIPGTLTPNVAYVLPSLPTMTSPQSTMSPTDSSCSLRSPSPAISTSSYEKCDSPPVDLSPRNSDFTPNHTITHAKEPHGGPKSKLFQHQPRACIPVHAGGHHMNRPLTEENVWRPW